MKISQLSKVERKVLTNKMQKRRLLIKVSKISKLTDYPGYEMDVFIKGIRFWIRISSQFKIDFGKVIVPMSGDRLPFGLA
jgi:hypothetical protein